MALKPAVMRDVLADTPTMGPQLAKKFTANPSVSKYAFVLEFPNGVTTGRAVEHSLRKLGSSRGPTLIAGDRFTLEASQVIAAAIGSEDFLWSDADYAKAREPFSSRFND